MRKLRSERRAERHRKTKHAPKGGTRGGQLVRMRVAKGYAGSARRFVRIRKNTK